MTCSPFWPRERVVSDPERPDARVPRMRPLSHRWLETTPWRDGRLPNGTRTRERDDSKESYTPVANAWHDDGGHGHYVLRCTRESEPEMP